MTTTEIVAALQAELERVRTSMAATTAPVIYLAGLTEGLSTAIRIAESLED